ncbi:hypothetical protein [Spirosoma koreense]
MSRRSGKPGYSVYEALYLSEKEESILGYIRQEYQTNLDKFSQPVIIAHWWYC